MTDEGLNRDIHLLLSLSFFLEATEFHKTSLEITEEGVKIEKLENIFLSMTAA